MEDIQQIKTKCSKELEAHPQLAPYFAGIGISKDENQEWELVIRLAVNAPEGMKQYLFTEYDEVKVRWQQEAGSIHFLSNEKEEVLSVDKAVKQYLDGVGRTLCDALEHLDFLMWVGVCDTDTPNPSLRVCVRLGTDEQNLKDIPGVYEGLPVEIIYGLDVKYVQEGIVVLVPPFALKSDA